MYLNSIRQNANLIQFEFDSKLNLQITTLTCEKNLFLHMPLDRNHNNDLNHVKLYVLCNYVLEIENLTFYKFIDSFI